MASGFFSPLRRVFLTVSVLENVPCANGKNARSAAVGWNVL